MKLAAWMVRFSCDDQDFFEVDPVRYRAVLGEPGLLAYRRAIEERKDGERVFAVRWARERLTVLDGDGEAIVAMLGGDLSAPHQFIRVCEAMVELGRVRRFCGGQRAASPRPTGGRSNSSTTWRALCTSGARPR